MQDLRSAVQKTRAWACYDCGKCTATCPIARAGDTYSPRRHVLAANLGNSDELAANGTLFHCLTCSLCDERCPTQVAYTDLVGYLRQIAHREGAQPECPHGGALQSVMRVMAKGETKQDRLGWLTDDLSVSEEKGEVFYWTGCTVYFDTLFSDFQVETLNATRAAIGLLNRLGVTPVVSAEERCCGHDLLWNGDRQSFELLAKHNTNLVAESGASLLLTSCAECLRTWRLDYEPFFEGKPPRIQHISEYLCEHLSELAPKSNGHPRVTYQDPCRLGRHLGVYEPPRKLLSTLGIELAEMPRKGSGAICCAGGTWSNCDRFAKSIQVDRLREARGTGATVLATACPKCQIHFRCAMKDPKLGKEISIETLDLAELVLAQTCSDQSTTEKEEGKEVSP